MTMLSLCFVQGWQDDHSESPGIADRSFYPCVCRAGERIPQRSLMADDNVILEFSGLARGSIRDHWWLMIILCLQGWRGDQSEIPHMVDDNVILVFAGLVRVSIRDHSDAWWKCYPCVLCRAGTRISQRSLVADDNVILVFAGLARGVGRSAGCFQGKEATACVYLGRESTLITLYVCKK